MDFLRNILTFFGVPDPDWLSLIVLGIYVVQCALLGLLGLYILVIHAWKLWRRQIRNQLRKKWSHYTNECYEKILARGYENVSPPWVPPFARAEFKSLLVEILTGEKNDSREMFLKLYQWYGFYAQDVKKMQSRSWWKRLEAISCLETMEKSELAPLLLKALNDRHTAVCLASICALTRLSFPDKSQTILKTLGRRAPLRHDVLIAVLADLAEQDATPILDYLKGNPPLHIAAACIQVLGRYGVKEAAGEIYRYLSFHHRNEEVLVAVIEAMGRLENQRDIARIEGFTSHESTRVRATAVEALIRLGAEIPEDLKAQWSLDPAPAVRRIMGRTMKRGAAA